jgi:hypothetical protein
MITELEIIDRIKIGALFGDYIGDQVVGQITASNGYAVTINPDTCRLWDNTGRYGYLTHFGGLYVCYTCGHLCDCYELED